MSYLGTSDRPIKKLASFLSNRYRLITFSEEEGREPLGSLGLRLKQAEDDNDHGEDVGHDGLEGDVQAIR